MAGDIRTLTMKILANTGDFTKGLKDAENSTKGFSSSVGSFLGGAAKAFGVVTAAVNGTAFAIGVTAVKAAVEAQREDALLEKSIQNLTNATDEQIKKTFEYLDAAENAAGVNSDQLKPSFERILRSVKDITEATRIQKVAQDIAAGTGKSLVEVSDSLARAYEGNVKGLKDLGIKLETTQKVTKKVKVSKDDLAKSELNATGAALNLQSAQERLNKVLADSDSSALDVAKAQNALEKAQLRASDSSDTFEKKQKNVGKSITETKDVAIPFSKLLDDLSKQYDGAAAAAAETYAGKLEMVRTSFTKIKEDLGTILLPALGNVTDFVKSAVVPAIEGLVSGLSREGKQGLARAFYDAGTGVVSFGYDMKTPEGRAYLLGEEIRKLIDSINVLLDIDPTSGESALTKLIDMMTTLVNKTEEAIKLYERFRDSFVGGALLDVSLQPLRTAGAAGSALLGGSPGQIINVNNTFGATNSKSQANTVVKSINNAAKAGTVNKFVKPMIPGR
jgi:hypothetical protein